MLEQDPQLTTTPFDKTSIENKYHCSIDVERAEEVLGAAIQVYLDKGASRLRRADRLLHGGQHHPDRRCGEHRGHEHPAARGAPGLLRRIREDRPAIHHRGDGRGLARPLPRLRLTVHATARRLRPAAAPRERPRPGAAGPGGIAVDLLAEFV